MARPKRELRPTLTEEELKRVARQQMAERGTAGLSLRGIARVLGVTAPAIYNYFPRLEDLITSLIVDAFTDQGNSMLAAGEPVSDGDGDGDGVAARIKRIALAYRHWAVDHPVDFQLIYGNPIPGYTAPAAITGPLALRPFLPMFRLYLQAWQAGELRIPPEYAEGRTPERVKSQFAGLRADLGMDMPDGLMNLLMSGWARIHGMVMLELFHHSQPFIGDPGEHYRYEVDAYMAGMGLRIYHE